MRRSLATYEEDEEFMQPPINYSMQEICPHRNFTLLVNNGNIMFNCKKCKLTAGEDKMDIFMPQLIGEYERFKGRVVQEVSLLEV